MPRPSNVNEIFDELLYEPKELEEANWQILKTKDYISWRAYVYIPKFHKLCYLIKATSPTDIWLRVSQYNPKFNIKDKEIIHLPLEWLPDGYMDDIRAIICKTLMSLPTVDAEVTNTLETKSS